MLCLVIVYRSNIYYQLNAVNFIFPNLIFIIFIIVIKAGI